MKSRNPKQLVTSSSVIPGNPSEAKLADLNQACEELGVTCVQGGNFLELADQGVDAIIAFC